MGRLALRVSIHALAASGGDAASAVDCIVRLSDLFSDMLAKQSRRLDQKDDDQNDEGNPIPILTAVGQISDDENLHKPENDPAQDGAGYVADATEHCSDKSFDARQQPHKRLDLRI